MFMILVQKSLYFCLLPFDTVICLYLTQKRVNHRDDDFTYVKGDFVPIVSEELWDRCAELRARRSSRQRGPDGTLKKFGRKEPRSVWCDKLRILLPEVPVA